MLNELFFLQTLLIISLIFFVKAINLLTIWYLAGIYLISLGLVFLLDDGDIFIGFLWVIDLGVGLIFFIFILHFSNFLYQKALINVFDRSLIFLIFFILFLLNFFYFIHNASDSKFNLNLKKTWFFFLSWYDYFTVYCNKSISQLNLLREVYFYSNSFEFFLINFMLFYGIFGALNLCFLMKKIFNVLSLTQLNSQALLTSINTNLFIRNQNFIKQQNTSTGVRVWFKKKSSTFTNAI